MRLISTIELSRLNRSQLFSLLTQLQAVLADLPEGTPERAFIEGTLLNVRTILAKPVHAPG